MKLMCVRHGLAVLCAWTFLALSACSTKPHGPVPVEDRVAGAAASRPVPISQPRPVSSPVAVSTPVTMGGSENAGKSGFYSVRSGDTLTKIALDHGQAWRDIAKWNGLDNPNVIEVDQVLRVAPPITEANAAKVAINSRPAATSTPSAAATTPAPQNAPLNAAPAVSPALDEGLVFAWPHPGQVLAGFDEAKNKGLDFAGKAGDPVLAAAEGKVVYAGSGLRGYGNLVILKHNNTYLTAYAHNQTLLVKEDQAVAKGQKIAEMGSSDADRVKLHFEIRKQGKPVDPAKLLPSRP
jgi:lipoprotein NlpD